MGVLNITPDSFSDGGQYTRAVDAIAHAARMIEEGADIIDIGAESSRPGALALSVEQEWARIQPVIGSVVALGKPVSVDTVKPEIMQAALNAGAVIINDIQAFGSAEALSIVAQSHCGVCVMHMQGDPRSMQKNPHYTDVVHEVKEFLLQRVDILKSAGIAAERICIDPGFGFGKHPEHNLSLMQAGARFVDMGHPVLIGVSRKSMIGHFTNKPDSQPAERVAGSLAAALYAADQGVHVLRVHDVRATVEALTMWHALKTPSRIS